MSSWPYQPTIDVSIPISLPTTSASILSWSRNEGNNSSPPTTDASWERNNNSTTDTSILSWDNNNNPPTDATIFTIWNLKDNKNNVPKLSDAEILFISQMKRVLFFPYPSFSLEQINIPNKPKPTKTMNNFMVFRRCLSNVAKQTKSSYDGKFLSRIASYMWNGASEPEKRGYDDITKQLKDKLQKAHPDFCEKRTRRRGIQFVDCNGRSRRTRHIPQIDAAQETEEQQVKEPYSVSNVPQIYCSPSLMCHHPVNNPIVSGFNIIGYYINQQQQHQQPQQQSYIEGDLNAGIASNLLAVLSE